MPRHEFCTLQWNKLDFLIKNKINVFLPDFDFESNNEWIGLINDPLSIRTKDAIPLAEMTFFELKDKLLPHTRLVLENLHNRLVWGDGDNNYFDMKGLNLSVLHEIDIHNFFSPLMIDDILYCWNNNFLIALEKAYKSSTFLNNSLLFVDYEEVWKNWMYILSLARDQNRGLIVCNNN